jgi:hypothetical protein
MPIEMAICAFAAPATARTTNNAVFLIFFS